jgi:hypothetical protein
MYYYYYYLEPLAQLVEHLTFNQRVEGSSPSWLTFTHELFRGLSSAGRAPALHAGGQRFDPARLHQLHTNYCHKSVVFMAFFYVFLNGKKRFL